MHTINVAYVLIINQYMLYISIKTLLDVYYTE